jgi:hypothetical protein
MATKNVLADLLKKQKEKVQQNEVVVSNDAPQFSTKTPNTATLAPNRIQSPLMPPLQPPPSTETLPPPIVPPPKKETSSPPRSNPLKRVDPPPIKEEPTITLEQTIPRSKDDIFVQNSPYLEATVSSANANKTNLTDASNVSNNTNKTNNPIESSQIRRKETYDPILQERMKREDEYFKRPVAEPRPIKKNCCFIFCCLCGNKIPEQNPVCFISFLSCGNNFT